jgi:uncharacterized membrane protein
MSTHRSFRLTPSATATEVDSGKVSMIFPVMQQFVILALAAMLLDGGECLQIVSYASLAYWVVFGMMMISRRDRLTQFDKILIRWGFLMLVMVSSFVTQFIWHLKGY